MDIWIKFAAVQQRVLGRHSALESNLAGIRRDAFSTYGHSPDPRAPQQNAGASSSRTPFDIAHPDRSK